MDEFASFVQNYTDQLLLGAAVAVIILIPVIGYVLHKAKKVPGEEPMKKEEVKLSLRQLRRQENTLMADDIGNLLLTKLAEGKITPERYQTWMLRFGKSAGLRDLLNGKTLTDDQKKKCHKARIKFLAESKPITFPKEKVKPKNVIEGLLNGTA